jgi:hypothetical protein
MLKTIAKRLSLLMIIGILSLCLAGMVPSAFAQGGGSDMAPQGGMPGDAGGRGMPEGMPEGMQGEPGREFGMLPGGGMPGGGNIDLTETSVINLKDGSLSINEDQDAQYSLAKGGVLNDTMGSGILITSEVTGPTAFNISDSTFTLGGETGYYHVTKDSEGVPSASLAKKGDKDTYNSVIILNDAAHTSEAAYAERAGELTLGVGVHNSGEGTFTRIDNAYVWTSGSVRSAVAIKSLSKVVVEDSHIESTGGITCHKPVTRLLLSSCRANLIMGGSAYYYNSTANSYDWGALSTDTGGPNNTYLYAYNVETLNKRGGYSAYADSNCFVYIYGCDMTSAEMGGFVASNGELNIAASSDATPEALEYMKGETLKGSKPTVITARRNAVVFHLVDSMSPGFQDGTSRNASTIGKMTVKNSTLSTVCELESARNYLVDPNDDASRGECEYYIEHHKGSVIALRSTNADIDLTNVTMTAAKNETTGKKVLIHSLLNYDARGAVYVKDGAEFAGHNISMKDMDVSGDILHEDYQRKMVLSLADTRIEGAVISGTMANWNAIWKGIDSEYVEEIYDMLAHDTTYDTVWGVRMSLDAKSAWTVTGDSTLHTLTIEKGAKVKAASGKKMTIYTSCKMDNSDSAYDYTTGTVVKELKPGVTYTGVCIRVES